MSRIELDCYHRIVVEEALLVSTHFELANVETTRLTPLLILVYLPRIKSSHTISPDANPRMISIRSELTVCGEIQ